MPYYVRAFCTSGDVPAISKVLEVVLAGGVAVTAELDDEISLSSADWEQCWLNYGIEKQPIVVECNMDEGEGSLCKDECAEFIEKLNELKDSPSRNRCINHLKKVKFIIVCQLLSDIDEEGFTVNDAFLDYFVDHCGGMMHAEGEGFYDNGKLIVPID